MIAKKREKKQKFRKNFADIQNRLKTNLAYCLTHLTTTFTFIKGEQGGKGDLLQIPCKGTLIILFDSDLTLFYFEFFKQKKEALYLNPSKSKQTKNSKPYFQTSQGIKNLPAQRAAALSAEDPVGFSLFF